MAGVLYSWTWGGRDGMDKGILRWGRRNWDALRDFWWHGLLEI